VNVTAKDLKTMKRARPAPRRERDVQAAIWVAGKLVNPLNARQGWKAVWQRSKRARATTRTLATTHDMLTNPMWGTTAYGRLPKRVTFVAHVGGKWDDDNLPAAIKAYRDGLVDARVIHADDPDSGHVFVYRQVIDRNNLGVEIIVQALGVAPPGARGA
jgi:hypothetical protein